MINPDEVDVIDFKIEDYKELLDIFDAIACESLSINQFTANRYVKPHIGYGSYIFTRLCIHAKSLLRATPLSRWSKTDFNLWVLSCIAGHVRAIMEGYLFYMYLSEIPVSEEEWKAKLWTMHMNDCVKRLKIMQETDNQERIIFFEEEKVKIMNELKSNAYFLSLPTPVQKGCLNGKFLMIYTRDELIEKYDLDKKTFDVLFDILSHYIHILPISYYSHEQNKRGSGLFNDTDLGYLCMCLGVVTTLLEKANTRLITFFPDAKKCMKGKKSIFSPGPRDNLPLIQRESNNKKTGKKRENSWYLS